MSALVLGRHGTAVRMETRVTPRASRNAIDGVRDGHLLIKVTAAPVDDAANRAVVNTVSEALRVPKRDVAIIAGERSRLKSVAISGMTADELRQHLSAILGHSV
jgi:uncharacterized protein (TIGR00251 family)